MKKCKRYIIALLLPLLAMTACKKDGDTLTLEYVAGNELVASSNELVLTNATAGSNVFSLSWSKDSIRISHSGKYGLATTALTNTLQFDTVNTFTHPKESLETGVQKLFTGTSLNMLVLSMGLVPEETRTIYIRLKTVVGVNLEPLYTPVVSLKITPFNLVSFLYMPGDLSGGWNSYTTKLCSPTSDGKYEGYVNAAQWNNFKFTEQTNTDGVVYGSVPNELYKLDPSAAQWNIWFDEAGYFLLKANTNDLTWSKTKINSFHISGDFNNWSTTATPMTYDAVNKVWTATADFQPGQWGNSFQIIANSEWTIVYGDEDGDGKIGAGEKVYPSAGMHTVIMNLSNPEKYTITIQ